MEKICNKCLNKKDLLCFGKDKRLQSGFVNTCSECLKGYKDMHYKNNKEKYILRAKNWKKENKEKVAISGKKSRENNKEYNSARIRKYQQDNAEKTLLKTKRWQENNKTKVTEQRKLNNLRRKSEDPLYVFKLRIRKMMSYSFKRCGTVKSEKTEIILGCSLIFFKSYIESQFKKEMNWQNIHIDHIKPLKYAKTEKEVLQLNHYTNLQPLLAVDNIKKSAKLITKQLKFL